MSVICSAVRLTGSRKHSGRLPPLRSTLPVRLQPRTIALPLARRMYMPRRCLRSRSSALLTRAQTGRARNGDGVHSGGGDGGGESMDGKLATSLMFFLLRFR